MSYPKEYTARSIEYFDLVTGLNTITQARLGENFWQGVTLTPINSEASDFFESPQFACTHPVHGEVEIRPKWVVGCDGRGSTVRKWMGGKSASKNGKVVLGTNHEFIFGTQLPEPVQNSEMYEVVRTAGQGTISYFSLGDSSQRIYLSSAAPNGQNPQALGEHFRTVLQEIKPLTGLQEIPETLTVSGYPANTEWFGPAARGRFLLVGDSLAVTTPYGGQGMTVAMEHVNYLTATFDWLNTNNPQLMTSNYEIRARSIHERVGLLNFGLYYTFFSRPSIFKYSTRHIVDRWERNRELKSRVARLFGGIDTDTPTILEILDLESELLTKTASRLTPRGLRKHLQWS